MIDSHKIRMAIGNYSYPNAHMGLPMDDYWPPRLVTLSPITFFSNLIREELHQTLDSTGADND